MKKLNMNKITNTDTQDCFFHADAQGRVYIGKGVKGDLTISIYDPSGDARHFKVKEQIAYSDIQLFQQCTNGYVFVYYESYEPKVKVFLEEGREKSVFHLPSEVSCCLLDEKQNLWVGLSDEGIYSDENTNGKSVLCFTLDGQLQETNIDQQLSEIYAPVVDDCYALAEKDGLTYMLYYSYTVIAAFDEMDVKRVWIISDKEYSGVYDQLAISNDGFWVCRDEHSLFLIPADVSQPVQEVKCCDRDGRELSIQQLKLTSNSIYALSDSGIYKRDIRGGQSNE
ncbi:DNA-binding protein [Bacillus halotolerans]|nr:DNA-binding protein [Bacillus halotolerans]